MEEKDKGDRKEEDGKMVGVSMVGTQVQLTDLSSPIWSSYCEFYNELQETQDNAQISLSAQNCRCQYWEQRESGRDWMRMGRPRRTRARGEWRKDSWREWCPALEKRWWIAQTAVSVHTD